eukprot:1164113-Rhodomonas_salina.2
MANLSTFLYWPRLRSVQRCSGSRIVRVLRTTHAPALTTGARHEQPISQSSRLHAPSLAIVHLPSVC